MRQCRVPGCLQPTSSQYSHHCNLHRAQLRRQGEPGQQSLTKRALAPYEERVRRRINRQPDNPVWAAMDARWDALVRDRRAYLVAYNGGRASPRQNILASEEIIRVDALVVPREVVVTVAAAVLMQQLDPHWFRSDRAFDVQLVRRVRALAGLPSTTYRDPRTGKARRAYQEMSPRAVEVMGEWLRIALGVLGMRLAMLEREERERDEAAGRELSDALMSLK